MNIIPIRRESDWTALEFFAGIGLARAGMAQAGIKTVWANDYDLNKKAMYEGHWQSGDFLLADIHSLKSEDLPSADIAWASSPCTDLSLAGKRVGLRGGRESSAFFGFTDLIAGMHQRQPQVILLENVIGLASSHEREDLRAAVKEFNALGYSVDAITLDARRFVPQSRPRLFIIGVKNPINGGEQDTCLRPDWLSWLHKDPELKTFMMPLPKAPDLLHHGFTDEIEIIPDNDTRWWSANKVALFRESMATMQRERLEQFVSMSGITARTAYRRTRNGIPVWEMRPEDISGCLRTPRGGSSKQAVVMMGNGLLKIRWMTGLEYARLMGAGWYTLDNLRDSNIQYGFGDAVVVPVVGWVAKNMIIPHLEASVNSHGKIVNEQTQSY